MRRLITYSLTILLVLAFSADVEAQLLNRLKKKAQKAAEDKIEQKAEAEMQKTVDRMVEDSWSAIFGDIGENGEPGKGFPFSLNSNVTTEDVYNFDVMTTMEIETIKKEGKSDPPVTMEMYFNEDELYTGTKFRGEEIKNSEGDFLIIYDLKNSAMLMLMESDKDEKFSFAYGWEQPMPAAEVDDEAEAEETETSSEDLQPKEEVDWDKVQEWNGYKKIGTKDLLGYSCDGYASESDHAKTELWVTRESIYGMGNLFSANANAKQIKGKIPENYPYGMLMELVTEDLRSGDKTTMKITKIDDNARASYSMVDYPVMSFGKKEKD